MRQAFWIVALISVACGVADAQVSMPAPTPMAAVTTPPGSDFLPPPIVFPLAEPIAIDPAHRLALIEANVPMPASDPRVEQAADLLTQATAHYVEDAGRIAWLTARASEAVRTRGRRASPLEILDGALRWKQPTSSRPGVMRRYEAYAALYTHWRAAGGLDHAGALARMQPGPSGSPQTP